MSGLVLHHDHARRLEDVRSLIWDICSAANVTLDEQMLEDISARLERIRLLLPYVDGAITPDVLRLLLMETA
jgi:hypothetical protein